MNKSIQMLFNANIRRALTWSFLHFSSYGRNKGQNSNRLKADDPLLESIQQKAGRKRQRIRERNLSLVNSGGMR